MYPSMVRLDGIQCIADIAQVWAAWLASLSRDTTYLSIQTFCERKPQKRLHRVTTSKMAQLFRIKFENAQALTTNARKKCVASSWPNLQQRLGSRNRPARLSYPQKRDNVRLQHRDQKIRDVVKHHRRQKCWSVNVAKIESTCRIS